MQSTILQLQEQIEFSKIKIKECELSGVDASPVRGAQYFLKAQLAFMENNYEESVAFYNDSIALFRDGGKYEEMATIAHDADLSFSKQNLTSTAFQFAQMAVDACGYLLSENTFSERLIPSKTIVGVFDAAIPTAYNNHDYHKAFEYIQYAKSRWLLDFLWWRETGYYSLKRLIPQAESLQAKEKQQRDLFDQALKDLDRQYVLLFENKFDDNDFRRTEESVNKEFNTLHRKVWGSMRIQGRSMDIAEIQTSLDDHEALLEFFVQSRGIYIFLITKDQFHPLFLPIDAERLGHLVLQAHIAVFQQPTEDGALMRREFKEKFGEDLGSQLSNIIKPEHNQLYSALGHNFLELIKDHIEGIKKLIICPNWILNIFPFQALIMKKDEYLIDSLSIVYSPSASIWSLLKTNKKQFKTDESNFLSIGVQKEPVDWFDKIQRFLNSLMQKEHISDFEEEAKNVAAKFHSNVLLGEDATKENVIKSFSKADIIHFSCHKTTDRKPPLLNGLVLEKGILTCTEIMLSKELESAEPRFISLSACRTGVDYIEAGDLLSGTAYAFLARFSCPILASLWPVDAEATRMLMETFYDIGLKGGDWAYALQEAQLSVKKTTITREGKTFSFSHPFFWSGFYLIGT